MVRHSASGGQRSSIRGYTAPMVLLAAVFAIVLSGAGCAIYGARIRYDRRLRVYRPREAVRSEAEEVGQSWTAGGAGLVVIALLLWWFTRAGATRIHVPVDRAD